MVAIIRPFRAADADEAAALIRTAFAASAFGYEGEAELVEAVRTAGDAVVELVAEEGGRLLGHVLCSRLLTVRRMPLAALAPLAVHPDVQRQGIGARLVMTGLGELRAARYGGVLVLGDAAYYGRFGLTAAAAETVRCPFSGPHLLGLAFFQGALEGAQVRYPAAFAAPQEHTP